MSGRVMRAVALLALAAAPPRARAQAQLPPALHAQPEARIDLIAGAWPAVQAGLGVQVPVGYYVRVGADAAIGMRTDAVSGSRMDGRVDLLGRFLLDPYRQSAIGFSAGAGLSARVEPGERVTPVLLVAMEVEGRRRASGWAPALQVGLGGGARVGVVLRRAEARAR